MNHDNDLVEGDNSPLGIFEDFLSPRIAEAEREEYIAKPPVEIFAEVKTEAKKNLDK